VIALLIKWTITSIFTRKIHPHKTLDFKDYTPLELSIYNGIKNSHIFIAVKGKVFDVTMSAGYYGPGSSYKNFSGRDASRGLAKNSFESELLTGLDQPIDVLGDLTNEENETLNEWYQFFSNKYRHVGNLVCQPLEK
jgi:membrane-associated progesterone receptor component